MGRRSGQVMGGASRCLVLGFVLCFVLGCGEQLPGVKFNQTNIRRLRTAYNIYARLNNLEGPKSEEEFKEFLKSDLTAKVRLERIGVDIASVDDIFISERDGKPFRIRYGLKGSKDQGVIFEEEGIDGKRFVALWDPVEVDAETYDQYWSGKKVAEKKN